MASAKEMAEWYASQGKEVPGWVQGELHRAEKTLGLTGGEAEAAAKAAAKAKKEEEERKKREPGMHAEGDTRWYVPDPKNYDYKMGVPGWAYQAGANQYGTAKARGMSYGGRDDYSQFLDELRNRPLDSDRLGQLMMQQGQEAVGRNVASQLASTPGRYNPAAARAALMQTSGAGQSMALGAHQQALASAIQERAARDAQLGRGYGDLSTADIQRMMAEMEHQRGMTGLGIGDKDAAAQMRRGYEQDKAAGWMGQTNIRPREPSWYEKWLAPVVGAIGTGGASLMDWGKGERKE